MGKTTTYMGGLKGTRKPQGTYFPSLRPGATELDSVRQATRHFNAPEFGATQVSGGSTSTSRNDNPTVLPVAQWTQVTLALANNSTTNYVLGAIATLACVHIKFWLRRNYAAAVRMAAGGLTLFHDGTNAFIDQMLSMDGASADPEVLFAASINGGNLRLDITVSDNVNTADVILYILPVNLP